MSSPSEKKPSDSIRPRIIIHGGAGNISRSNLPRDSYHANRSALLSILHTSSTQLSFPGATSLDIATHAVSQLENSPLFKSGHGAVFTTNGTHELEASVMASTGYRKRGVGIMETNRIKNPILMAREMLVLGEDVDGNGYAARGRQYVISANLFGVIHFRTFAWGSCDPPTIAVNNNILAQAHHRLETTLPAIV